METSALLDPLLYLFNLSVLCTCLLQACQRLRGRQVGYPALVLNNFAI